MDKRPSVKIGAGSKQESLPRQVGKDLAKPGIKGSEKPEEILKIVRKWLQEKD